MKHSQYNFVRSDGRLERSVAAHRELTVHNSHATEVIYDAAVGGIGSSSRVRTTRPLIERWQRRLMAFSLRKAIRRLQNEDPQSAFPILQRLSNLAPNQLVVRILLARCVNSMQDEALTRSILSLPLAADISSGKRGSYLRRAGEIYGALFDFQAADRCFEQARQLLPRSQAVERSIGWLRMERDQDLNGALRHFSREASNPADRQINPMGNDHDDGPASLSNAYDLVPYPLLSFRQTHPDSLTTIARLVGHNPVPTERCRVLELGCGSGANLLPMADQLPESTFLGIDASSRQIDMGRKLQLQAGLTNIELRCQDILNFESDEPFDYIICHGVYSWVPAPVRQQIFAICQKHLARHGIAYVSYNTLPGWHQRGLVRDFMMYRGRSVADPLQKLARAKAMLPFLMSLADAHPSHYTQLLKNEISSMYDGGDAYLLHDYLEEVNAPCYLYEFLSNAGQFGLKYMGEANYSAMAIPLSLPQRRLVEPLLRESRDGLEAAQYLDFLQHRTFRQTLLCHADLAPAPSELPHRLELARVASNASLASSGAVLTSTGPISYRREDKEYVLSDPAMKVAISHLSSVWPNSIPFGELFSFVSATLAKADSRNNGFRVAPTKEAFAYKLLRCFALTVVDLTYTTSRFRATVGERPCASRLMRAQAEHGREVTSRSHSLTLLTELQRQLLVACDGTRTVADLKEYIYQRRLRGELIDDSQETSYTGPDTARHFAQDSVPTALDSMARGALFID